METKKKPSQKSKINTKAEKPKKVKELPKINWYLINAQGKILGKVAARAAGLLLGKHNPVKKSYEIASDRVVIINASKVSVTGKKESQKKYYRYSGYPGGLRERTLEQLREEKPNEIINHAIFGMLPKNRMGRSLRKHLYVYSSGEHPHEAQKVETVEV